MRPPKTWGFVLRADDLHAVSRRRFVLRFSAAGTLLEKTASPGAPAAKLFLPRRRR